MRSTVLSRRSVAIAAISLVAALGLAACGTQNTPSASSTGAGGTTDTGPTLSSGDVTLRVNWWGGDARVQRTNKAIDAFEAKYPNIHVTGEFSDWNGYWDKLATSVAGGNAPDVVQMDELYLASYAQRDTLYDLSKLSQLDTSQLDPGVVGLGKSNGTLDAMPISTTGFGIMVNDDALAQLGLTLPDTDTWTWDDLSAFAKKISDASGGSAVGISPMNNGYSLRLWARQHGEELFTDGKVSISTKTLAGFFQLALDWTKSGAAASASHQAEVASVALDQSDIATGKQVLSFTQATQISAYSAAAGDAKFSLVPIPTDDANKAPYGYLKPGMYWAVSAKSAHPAEAALFVNFMINDPDAGAILGTERGIPSNPKVVDAVSGSLSATEKIAADFDAKVAEHIGDAPEITPNGGSALDATIARYLQEVTFERQTPADAAKAFTAEIQDSIDSAS